jgi:hypothetical protein
MPSPLDHALASGKPVASASTAPRTALAIGTVGRVGEELINCLLESPHYSAVNVVVEAPMRSMLARLTPWQVSPADLQALASGTSRIALPRVDDVFCCLSDARSYFKRDQAYVQLRKEQIPALAQAAALSGARRFVLLAPLSAFLQLSGAGGLLDIHESDLAAARFETLIIVRPAAEYGIAQGNAMERLIAWGAKAILQIMVPQRLQPLRARQIAQAAVNAATILETGVHIVGAERIAELVTPGVPVEVKRRRL